MFEHQRHLYVVVYREYTFKKYHIALKQNSFKDIFLDLT